MFLTAATARSLSEVTPAGHDLLVVQPGVPRRWVAGLGSIGILYGRFTGPQLSTT